MKHFQILQLILYMFMNKKIIFLKLKKKTIFEFDFNIK